MLINIEINNFQHNVQQFRNEKIKNKKKRILFPVNITIQFLKILRGAGDRLPLTTSDMYNRRDTQTPTLDINQVVTWESLYVDVFFRLMTHTVGLNEH